MSAVEFKYVSSAQGKRQAVVDKYIFMKNKNIGETTYWCCVNKKKNCTATLQIKNEEAIMKNDHNQEPLIV
jgi:FLYWCH-type zinc finger protein